MSFTEAAREIARRDAKERLSLATSRKDAYRILEETEGRGDAELARGIRHEIAERWPTHKPVDYTPRLKVANSQILAAVLGARQDASAQRTSKEYSQRKMSRDIFERTYPPLVAPYVAQIDKVLTSAKADLDKASKDLANEVNKLLAKPTGSVEAQLLHETQAQRAWNRLKPQLDTLDDKELIGSIDSIVADAVGPGARAAVVDELPAYISARGLDRVLGANAVQEALVQSDPMTLAADKAETRAYEYFLVVKHNATHMRDLIVTRREELFSMELSTIYNFDSGREPRFIPADQAELKGLTAAETAAAAAHSYFLKNV